MDKGQWLRRAALGFFLGLWVFCPPGAEAKNKLKLKKVYEYRLTKGLEGPLDFTLDPTGKYFYLVDKGAAEIRVLDWKSKKEVVRRRFSLKDCPPQEPLKLEEMRFIAGTPWLALNACEALWIVNAQTLEVVEELTEMPEEVNDELLVQAAPNGKYLSVLRREYGQGKRADKWTLRLFGYGETGWRQLAEWEPELELAHPPDQRETIQATRFTPDSESLVAITSRRIVSADDYDVCGTLVYEVPTGRLTGKYHTTTPAHCRLERWFEFLSQNPGVTVSRGFSSGGQDSAIIFRKLPSRERLAEIIVPGTFLSSYPSLSPDRELLTMATCYSDPGAPLKPCAVFTIWDVNTREIVYETPKWIPWPTRWAVPRFASDGKHLLVHRPGKIEINEILYQE